MWMKCKEVASHEKENQMKWMNACMSECIEWTYMTCDENSNWNWTLNWHELHMKMRWHDREIQCKSNWDEWLIRHELKYKTKYCKCKWKLSEDNWH